MLERVFLVHRHFINLHAQLHDFLILGHDLILSLLELLISIVKLSLQVLQFHFELVVNSHSLIVRCLMLLGEGSHGSSKLLNQILLVAQLIFDHLQFLFILLQVRIIFRRYLQFDVILLKLLNLLMQVVKLGLVLLDFILILGYPLFVLSHQFKFVLFELLNLFFPLVVSLAFEQLDLSLELLNHIFLLLQLHVVVALICKVTAVIAVDSRN